MNGETYTSQISAALSAGQSGNQVHRWRAFAVLAVSLFMAVVDLTIVNVALPTIGRKLHVPESSLQWVVTGYGARLRCKASYCSAAAPRTCWGAAAS